MKKYLIIVAVLLLAACGSSKNVSSKRTKARNVNTSNEKKVLPTSEALKEVEKEVNKTKKNAKGYLNANTLSYIKQFAPLAMDEMRKFKIPASITLAQGILESGSGRSGLSLKSNNHFGIKCHKGWKGERVYHDDDAKGECFRKYNYPATSYQDHSLFLTTRFRYAFLFGYKKDDYKAWAKGLKKAGYATDPKYPKKLISFIEKYELYKYDKIVLKGKTDEFVSITKREPVVYEKVAVKKQKRRKRSGKGIHIVKDDDTLYSVSRKYGMTVEELKQLNDLTSNIIQEGSELKLRSNAKKSDHHIVRKKETLYSISKKYNVSVYQLIKLNNLRSNDLFIGQELRIE